MSFRCVNCDGALQVLVWPFLYCSELCRQEAGYVRYARRVHKDGRDRNPDVQEALLIRLSMILGGGYPARERHLSPAQRAAVFARSFGRCRQCGAQATEIDHIGPPIEGDINHRDNLRALCTSCHRRKSLDALEIITPEGSPEQWAQLDAKVSALEERIRASLSLQPADDDVAWASAWRRMATERKRAMVESALKG